MKKLLALAAVSTMLTASAFAICPCQTERTMTYTTPIKVASVQPVASYQYVPFLPSGSCCKKCDPCGKKTGFFNRVWNGTTKAYNNTVGSLFNNFWY